MPRSAKYFMFCQALLYVGLIVCVVLQPAGAYADVGISYYGVFPDTIAPYLIALIGGGVLGYFTARSLGQFGNSYLIRHGLILFGVLVIGVAVTPYDLGDTMYHLHTAFGSLLFALQLALTGWLTFWLVRNWRTVTLWSLELLAGLASAWYLIEPDGYLFFSQLAFQVFFGSLMLYMLIKLDRPAKRV